MGTSEKCMENLNLSTEEMKNMTSMMKDPKFMELFADYAKEISDPNNRKEMEDALRDAESRGEKVPGFPSNKDLLIPSAAFCAKTRNEMTGAKVFINICYSEKIAEPKGIEAKDRSGTAWEIPYSLGPAHTDTDKQGAACEVHDFVVSTTTRNMASVDGRFKNFLVETAIDAIQKQRHVKLSQGFILLKLKYKGQTKEPKMLTIPKGPHQPLPPTKTDQVSTRPKPLKSTTNSKKMSEAASKDLLTSGGEIEPKFTVVYRNHLNFTKFWDDTINLPTEKDKPTEIVCRVELPTVITMKDIQLEVTKHGIQLVVPSKYYLQLKLQYQVDEEKGQAKFDTTRQQLEITLPIHEPPHQVLN